MTLPDNHYRTLKRDLSLAELLADGIVHALALLAGLIAFPLLLFHGLQNAGAGTFVALTVYAAGFFLMWGFSLAYNMTPPSALKWLLRRFDHSMIYVLIASSYAPFAYHLDEAPRKLVLSIAIGGGLLGWLKAHAWPRAPRLVTSGIYLLIGWCMAPYFPELYASIGLKTLGLLLVGGLFYTGGALIYWLRLPDPWPRTFGYHEVNHALGIVGATCHFLAIWSLLT